MSVHVNRRGSIHIGSGYLLPPPEEYVEEEGSENESNEQHTSSTTTTSTTSSGGATTTSYNRQYLMNRIHRIDERDIEQVDQNTKALLARLDRWSVIKTVPHKEKEEVVVEEVQEEEGEEEKEKDGDGGGGSFGPNNRLMSDLWNAVVPKLETRLVPNQKEEELEEEEQEEKQEEVVAPLPPMQTTPRQEEEEEEEEEEVEEVVDDGYVLNRGAVSRERHNMKVHVSRSGSIVLQTGGRGSGTPLQEEEDGVLEEEEEDAWFVPGTD